MPPPAKEMLRVSRIGILFWFLIWGDLPTIEDWPQVHDKAGSRNAGDWNGTLQCCFGDGVRAGE
jgi:hypothetical protein